MGTPVTPIAPPLAQAAPMATSAPQISVTATTPVHPARPLWISRPYPAATEAQGTRNVGSKLVHSPTSRAQVYAAPLRTTSPQPPSPRYDHAVIWLHGLGDTEEGWRSIFEEILPPRCKLVTPRAPLGPVTCNGGQTMTRWFDMETLPVDPQCLPPNHGCSIQDALSAVRGIHATIDELVQSGIPSCNIIVGGFSQGGAVAVFTALTYPQKLAGCIIYSGLVLCSDTLPRWLTQRPNVLWIHGSSDEVVSPLLQHEGCEALANAGLVVKFQEFSGGHCYHAGMKPEILKAIRGWFGF